MFMKPLARTPPYTSKSEHRAHVRRERSVAARQATSTAATATDAAAHGRARRIGSMLDGGGVGRP